MKLGFLCCKNMHQRVPSCDDSMWSKVSKQEFGGANVKGWNHCKCPAPVCSLRSSHHQVSCWWRPGRQQTLQSGNGTHDYKRVAWVEVQHHQTSFTFIQFLYGKKLPQSWKKGKSLPGTERFRYAYVWRTLMKAGVHVAGGSDAPVEAPTPLVGMADVTWTHKPMAPDVSFLGDLWWEQLFGAA